LLSIPRMRSSRLWCGQGLGRHGVMVLTMPGTINPYYTPLTTDQCTLQSAMHSYRKRSNSFIWPTFLMALWSSSQ
jgi:hypothetical protein